MIVRNKPFISQNLFRSDGGVYMFMSFLEKLQLVFQYAFSSFLEMSLLILTLLFFVLLALNIKHKKKIINYVAIVVMVLFMWVIIFLNKDYAVYCVDFLLKGIMKYVYFPSTVVYFFIIFLTTVILVITVVSNQLTLFKKVINYLCFGMLYFLFFSFIGIIVNKGVNLADKVQLYTNDLLLAIVQISNFVFIGWLIYTIFWHLFRYFKKKYD